MSPTNRFKSTAAPLTDTNKLKLHYMSDKDVKAAVFAALCKLVTDFIT
jgi:hypothetical protein